MAPSTFVAKIDLKLSEKLKGDLEGMGFSLSSPPYPRFSAQKKGVSCTLYESGKLTVQGKEKDEFITCYLEPEILKSFDYSYPHAYVDRRARIGIDEAGKGDFFGPLCIAGVQAGEDKVAELLDLGVRDSKKMADSVVLAVAKKIRSRFPHAIVRISPNKYNELYERFKNLNHLLAWGHATAISDLVSETGCKEVIIDKFASEHLVTSAVAKKGLTIHLEQRVRAEEDVVVAAASIVARAHFLEQLAILGAEFGMELPKGAANHVIEAGKAFVAKHGRESLRKVAKLHFKTTDLVLSNHA